jgi:hypothetical protein
MKLARIMLWISVGLIFLGGLGSGFAHNPIINPYIILFAGFILAGLSGLVAILADHFFPNVK